MSPSPSISRIAFVFVILGCAASEPLDDAPSAASSGAGTGGAFSTGSATVGGSSSSASSSGGEGGGLGGEGAGTGGQAPTAPAGCLACVGDMAACPYGATSTSCSGSACVATTCVAGLQPCADGCCRAWGNAEVAESFVHAPLVVDSSGTRHMVYWKDGTTFYAKRSGATWEPEPVSTTALSRWLYLDDGLLHIVTVEGANIELRSRALGGTTWGTQLLGTTPAGMYVAGVDVVFVAGVAHVFVAVDTVGLSSADTFVRHYRSDAIDWGETTVFSESNVRANRGVAADVTPSGELVMATLLGDGRAILGSFDGDNWLFAEEVAIDLSASGADSVETDFDLAVDSQGEVQMVYSTSACFSGIPCSLFALSGNGLQWQKTVVDVRASRGVDLHRSSNGTLHLGYAVDEPSIPSGLALQLAHWTPCGWHIGQTVDARYDLDDIQLATDPMNGRRFVTYTWSAGGGGTIVTPHLHYAE